jgi:Fe-S oxidoreductase
MAIEGLKKYEEWLYGCRFCPMCKPAAEVANVTFLESHTTRARAMILWRVANGIAEFSKRDAELLYQSTLDSISEAWCVSHYPVSAYLLAARAEVYRKGLAPERVLDAINRKRSSVEDTRIEDTRVRRVLLASEAHEIGDKSLLDPVLSVFEDASVVMISSGAVEFSLGAAEEAMKCAKKVIERINGSGVEEVIADGPETLWALRYVYPLLGVELPGGVKITSITEALEEMGAGSFKKKGRLFEGKKALFHDSRCACSLADELAQDAAIQPGYRGSEEAMGKGKIYEAPRKILDEAGMERVFTVWMRSLSRSCGADDGLWLTYPELAEKLGLQLFAQAEELGAEFIVADSLLCSAHLKRIAPDGRTKVLWLPEIAV